METIESMMLCACCGESFTPSIRARSTQRYCSALCRWRTNSEVRSGYVPRAIKRVDARKTILDALQERPHTAKELCDLTGLSMRFAELMVELETAGLAYYWRGLWRTHGELQHGDG